MRKIAEASAYHSQSITTEGALTVINDRLQVHNGERQLGLIEDLPRHIKGGEAEHAWGGHDLRRGSRSDGIVQIKRYRR